MAKAAPALFKQLNEALAGGEGDDLIKGTKVCVGAGRGAAAARMGGEEDEKKNARPVLRRVPPLFALSGVRSWPEPGLRRASMA
jgi:hypothetical protein